MGTSAAETGYEEAQVEGQEVEGQDEEGEPKTATGTLTVEAPDGSEFEMEEVKTNRGTRSLGQVPILVWNNLQRALEFYGEEGLCDILDGTSLRVSFQGIARRFAAAGKTVDEIAQAQINFRPGKRAVGVSTPASRAGNAAKKAAAALGDKADTITRLMERIAKGEVTDADLAIFDEK